VGEDGGGESEGEGEAIHRRQVYRACRGWSTRRMMRGAVKMRLFTEA
jgi:hypothetical protein